MHPYIRTIAAQAGFTEDDPEHKLLVLSYGIEQIPLILSALDGQQVDTVVSMLTLCSIPPSVDPSSPSSPPSPKTTIREFFVHVLAPGGIFIFYEHVLNHRPDIARVQRFWAPLWEMVFDGCRVDRPTDVWLRELGVAGSDEMHGKDDVHEALWCEGEMGGLEGESDDHHFWHQLGWFVKRKDN